MQIDLRTVTIKPLRHTFDNIARRIGADKPASRYQEGTLDMQQEANYHYRPTWDPDHLIYDRDRSAIRMADWYSFKDPRQFYYGAYTIARAKQQDTAEANFDFVENRGLAATLPDEIRDTVLALLIPLRHVAWGANMNNAAVCAYGYGTAFTQPCIYHAMDQLGIAQYLTRVGLLLGDVDSLDAAKQAWMEDDTWQGLRRYVEDTLVLRDPFELFVAQNVALDGLLYPLVYARIVDDELSARGASAVAMLTQFMAEWFDETRKWVDAVLKTATAESDHNREVLQGWMAHWSDRAAAALVPVVELVLGVDADEAVAVQIAAFEARIHKTGISF